MTIKHRDWAAAVKALWGPEFHELDAAYGFSNGRVFKDPGVNGAVYRVNLNAIDQETQGANLRFPDLLTEDFGRILQE